MRARSVMLYFPAGDRRGRVEEGWRGPCPALFRLHVHLVTAPPGSPLLVPYSQHSSQVAMQPSFLGFHLCTLPHLRECTVSPKASPTAWSTLKTVL